MIYHAMKEFSNNWPTSLFSFSLWICNKWKSTEFKCVCLSYYMLVTRHLSFPRQQLSSERGKKKEEKVPSKLENDRHYQVISVCELEINFPLVNPQHRQFTVDSKAFVAFFHTRIPHSIDKCIVYCDNQDREGERVRDFRTGRKNKRNKKEIK
jgi:hypothetical protein